MKEIKKLLEVMEALRTPVSGCPWDLKQDFDSIAPYTVEEAYEVADAISRGAYDELREELGDLLFQVVFHARMAEERELFDFSDVVTALVGKLTRRHPHVFAAAAGDSATLDEVNESWEAGKARERAERAGSATDVSALDDIPLALPALSRAQKLGKRASRVGFDWPNRQGVEAKLTEELAELAAELARDNADEARISAELGDVLFTAVNLCRHVGASAETALSGANRRFETRFRHMERALAASDTAVSDTDPAELERLWEAAKMAEKG